MNTTTQSRARHVSPNGYCLLPIHGRLHTVIGGPFDAFAGGYGVCLEKHSSKASQADLLFDVPDFGVPTKRVFESTLLEIVHQMLDHPDVPVFVGCRGGIGRTGLVIAGLVRALGVEDVAAVKWVREHYLPGAVETDEQRALIQSFDVRPIRTLLDARKPVVITKKLSLMARIWALSSFARD